MALTGTGLIPSKADECTLNIYVSEVDCSPSRKLSKQLSAENTKFDKAKFAKGGYTLLYVKYTSPEIVSGFQFEIDIPAHHNRIAVVGTKIGETISSGEEGSETCSKKFIVFQSKNTVIGLINPDVSGSALSTSYNLSAATTDTALCYILLEKNKSFTGKALCPDEVTIKNIKACRNMNSSGVAVLTPPKANWKGRISSKLGLSDVYFASKLLASNTYNRDLDANNDGAIDIIDIVALANKKHNNQFNKATDKIVPDLICKDHEDFVTKSDLVANLEIMKVSVSPNMKNPELFDLNVIFGVRSSNSISGMQFDFGQDIFGSSDKKESLSFLGPLKEREKTWNYKFETIKNRFNKDKITRIMAWQGPIDSNKTQIKYDLKAAEQILVINSLEPQNVLTPILKYTTKGNDLNGSPLPKIKYYYADELGSNIQVKEEVLKSKRKGDRYYGPVSISPFDGQHHTGQVFSRKASRRLITEWNEFEIFNERIVTNDYLNYFEHTDQKLTYSGFDLVYNPNKIHLRDHFENDLEAYFQYLINYLYLPLRNGLDTPVSRYALEPSSSEDFTHNGYISDCNLDGTKDISDTVSFVNIATQKLSTTETDAVTILKDISRNEAELSFKNVIGSTNPVSISDINADKKLRSNLKSLSKIVPTYLLNNFTTTTFPHHVPSIKDQNTEGAILSFSQRVDYSGSNVGGKSFDLYVPKEFKNMTEYFNDVHDVKYHQTPPYNEYSFFKVNLATNSNKINFIKSAEFMIDFLQAYPTGSVGNGKVWIYPGEGFPSGSYRLKVRTLSHSGSIWNPGSGSGVSVITGSFLPRSGEHAGKLHIKLEITGSDSLATPITFDGGHLNLVKIFLSPIPDFISGKYISFADSPSSASIQSVDKPLDRAVDDATNFIEYTTGDRLVLGPKSSYLSQQYDDNSSSPQTYADYLLHLRAVGPSQIDVEYTTIKPFNTASFEVRCVGGIEIESIDTDLYYPSLAGYTASLSSSTDADGKTVVTLKAAVHQTISGSGQLMRLKTNRQLFDYELLQTGRELITPPHGKSVDLIIPAIDKTIVFPQTNFLALHLDPSKETWVRTKVSGSENIVAEIANPYGIPNLSQSATASCPLWDNSSSSFKENIHYLNFERSNPPQFLQSSPYSNGGYSHLDISATPQMTLLTVITPTSLAHASGTIFYMSSSANMFKVETLGTGSNEDNAALTYGGLRITTSGSDYKSPYWSGHEHRYNYAFTNTAVNRAHLLVITADGTENTDADGNAYANPSGSLLRHNGTQQTSSYARLTPGKRAHQSYTIGGSGSLSSDDGEAVASATNTSNYFIGHIGETIFFHSSLDTETIRVFEGYLAHKWGIEGLLPANHVYKEDAPNVANTTINNKATEAAIQLSQNYFANSGSTSDRSSALIISKLVGINDMTIASGSTTFASANYDLLRELPIEINQSSSANDASIFVNRYDQKTGILELGYKSSKKVDGYWVQLGNNISGSVYDPSRVGIVDVDYEHKSEATRKHWNQVVGFGPNEAGIYNKDPKRVRALKQIAFGYSSGRIKKLSPRGISKKIKKDDYRSEGAWYIPPTPAGESKCLTNLKIDPKSFNGVPSIKSWRLVTNTKGALATGSWTGNTDGGTTIGFDDLTAVTRYAAQGFYATASSNDTIATQAKRFDSESNRKRVYIDIVDVLAVANHLVEGSGSASKIESANIVPVDVCANMDSAPGSLTVTATAKSCDSGSAVTVAWTTSSGLANGYEVWRRGSVSSTNKRKKSTNFMFLGDREKLFDNQSQKFELIKVINTGSTNSYVDKEAPYNENCCSDLDNPKIEYTVVAFNKGGESTGKSSAVRLSCCNIVPVANTSNVTSSINTAVTFTVNVVDNSASPPFGTASVDTDDIKALTFKIIDYGNGEFTELTNNSGMFTFTPRRDFLGKTKITYEVINSSGCKATSSVDLVITPSKFTPTTTVLPTFDNGIRNIKFGTVKLSWDRLDVKGKILKYDIHRATSGSVFSATGSLIKTISGSLPVTRRFVNFYDKIPSAGTYKYKVTAFGFQGDPVDVVKKRKYSSIDSDKVYVTIASRATASNPESVTVTTSSFTSSNHPQVDFSWPGVTTPEVAQYYKVYRSLNNLEFLHIGTVGMHSQSTYTYTDKALPKPKPRFNFGQVAYDVRYRIASISYDGENGNPNLSWSGTNYSTYTASIKGTSNIPEVQDKEFSFCNPNLTGVDFKADISGLVSNEVRNSTTQAGTALTTTFARTSDGVAGLTLSSNGGFVFSGSTNGTFTFNYTATSGEKTSANGTITLRVLNCEDLTCPDGEKAKHIICDAYDAQGEYSKTVAQIPFGLQESSGRIVRSTPKAYSVTRGNNPGSSGSW